MRPCLCGRDQVSLVYIHWFVCGKDLWHPAGAESQLEQEPILPNMFPIPCHIIHQLDIVYCTGLVARCLNHSLIITFV